MNSAQYYSMMLVNAKRFVSVCESSLCGSSSFNLVFHPPIGRIGLTTPTNREETTPQSEVSFQATYLHNLHSNGSYLTLTLEELSKNVKMFLFFKLRNYRLGVLGLVSPAAINH